MKEILNLLPYLGVAMILNIVAGTWYNVKVQDFKFDWKILANGVWKALCLAGIYIGLAYIFDGLPSLAETIGVTPTFIIKLAIATYTALVIVSLAKIQGINIKVKELNQTSKEEK